MHRNPEGELRVLVFQAGRLDTAAVHLDNALGDIQPESCALDVVTAGFIDLVEPLENAFNLLGGNALAAVADRDIDLLHIVYDVEMNLAALRRKLDRIVDEVVDNLREQIFVAGNHYALQILETRNPVSYTHLRAHET